MWIMDVQENVASLVSGGEVEMDAPKSTFFVASEPNTSRNYFVEVFGKDVAEGNLVFVLSFRQYDRFRQTLLESPELEPIRQAMKSQGVQADLVAHGLGPGKLFVPPEKAWPALAALHKLVRQRGRSM